MNFLLIIPYYFSWHYKRGIVDYFKVWKNLIWFLWNFFSIKVLFKTFFMPFQKLKEDYSGGLDIENFLSSIVVTTLMRMVGMFFRSVIIITGLISIFSFIILGLMGMVVWLTLPLIIVWFVITSIIALLK
jgi:hypothetical protein